MKYILVIDHIATGGAERILIDYYHYLKQKGHVPYVFVLSGYSGQTAMLQFCSQCVLVHFQVPAHRTSMQTKLERDLGLVKSF